MVSQRPPVFKTAEIASVKANVPLNDILDMSTRDAWLFTRGEPAKRVKKYNPAAHPEYVNVTDAFGEDEVAVEDEVEEEEIAFGFC